MSVKFNYIAYLDKIDKINKKTILEEECIF